MRDLAGAQHIEKGRAREAVAGANIAACDTRLGTLALQHPGADRLAVGEYFIGAEGGVAGADELCLLARRERDALPVVELAISGPRRWRRCPAVISEWSGASGGRQPPVVGASAGG